MRIPSVNDDISFLNMWKKSLDEVINGFAKNIWVTLHKDGRTISVEDDGRGIPIDTVKSQSAMTALFILFGACVYENSRPVIETIVSPSVRIT